MGISTHARAFVFILCLFSITFAVILSGAPSEYEEKITFIDEERINFTEVNIPTLTLVSKITGTKQIKVIDRWEIQLQPIVADFPIDTPEEAKFNRVRVPIFKTKTITTFSITEKYVSTPTIIGISYIVKVPRVELVPKEITGVVKK